MKKYFCKELNKNFTTQKELISALIKHHDEIVSLKKAVVKYSDSINYRVSSKSDALKSLSPSSEIGYGSIVYPVINTTGYLDSHSDVHIPGIWNKSVPEQKGKVYLIINHDLEVGKVISFPKDVEPFVQVMKWTDLGRDYEGETEALIFKSKLTERSNKDGFEAYKYNDPVEHSIRMQYVKLYLCIKDVDEDDPYDVQYKENWEKYYSFIVNKDDADEQGYFWAVTEAKIFKEGSMVLSGSNDITPTLYDLENKNEPLDNTHSNKDDEPRLSTQLTSKFINSMFNN
ncbi:hypothetical protein AS589_09415 [Empedobacter brevis]|uniref:hypothetical protein n=1 Tax=Empedobacter brevis TaxID=247 RepID=UPI00131F4AD3|nr:hypothetical protein [Empedobacter brevis]QHC84973.1 hypothetical protein AS589_09415 [Empedobacter brevis]